MRRLLNYYRFYLRAVAYLLPLFSYEITRHIRFTSAGLAGSTGLDPYGYLSLLLVTTVVWAIAAERYGVSNVQNIFIERTGIRAAVAAWSTTYALILALLFFYRYESFSRSFLLFSAVTLLWMTLAMRAAFRTFIRHYSELRKPNRILIIGTDRFARQVARRLTRGPLSVCRVVGYVNLNGQEIAVDGAPVYPFEQIERIKRELRVDEIILAIPPSRFSEIPDIMQVVERFCVPVRAIIDFGDHILVRDRLFQFGRLQILDLAATPAESVKYSLLKRAFDVLFSIIVIFLTAPLMILIALVVRLASPGPALFTQDRVGLNGKIFRMYKFRTMKVATASESDTKWTNANDPRRTAVGIFLRTTSLDELPQFFNVLKGDMSVVGPRPERPRFVQKFLSEVDKYNNRHRLKVGITGWAQVNGWRGDTSIRRRVEYDMYYLQNWSFAFDLWIILITVFAGLRGKNAY